MTIIVSQLLQNGLQLQATVVVWKRELTTAAQVAAKGYGLSPNTVLLNLMRDIVTRFELNFISLSGVPNSENLQKIAARGVETLELLSSFMVSTDGSQFSSVLTDMMEFFDAAVDYFESNPPSV